MGEKERRNGERGVIDMTGLELRSRTSVKVRLDWYDAETRKMYDGYMTWKEKLALLSRNVFEICPTEDPTTWNVYLHKEGVGN